MTVLQLISEEGKPVSEVIGPIDTRYRSGEINTRVADAKSVMADVEKRYAAEGATIDHLDGVTIGFPDWWFNLRASNTEPLLRLNAEAETPELLATKTADWALRSAGVSSTTRVAVVAIVFLGVYVVMFVVRFLLLDRMFGRLAARESENRGGEVGP